IAGIKGYGLEMVDRVPLLIEATPYNMDYLATKAEKLGHLLLQTYLITVAIHWQEMPTSATERYERLEKLRHLVKPYDLLLQEEARSVAIALFGRSSLIVHLGFDQAGVAEPDWYHDAEHPYVQAIAQILDHIATWPLVERLEFLVSPGHDPMISLQVQLDRQIFDLRDAAVKPSVLSDRLETQRIYVFDRHTPEAEILPPEP
ncbi:MAG TPA: bifunctional 3,4-dihydroxy-2-butanone-4-phosphate synthase/GTP cyclohydrolase II, partial [Chroococcidiopsis sp.]